MRALTVILTLLTVVALGFVGWQFAMHARNGASQSRAQPSLAIGPQVVAPQPPPVATTTQAKEQPTEEDVIDWRELNSRAIRFLEQDLLDDAVSLFEECYEAVPTEDAFRKNLAEALARLAVRDHDSEQFVAEGALDALERAVELAPERTELAQLLARWQRSEEAEEDFTVHQTLHFEISFDYKRTELSDEFYKTGDLETLLEDTYHEFGERFAFFPVEAGSPRIRVVVYRRKAFETVTGLGSWVGGVFDGSVRVPIESLAKSQRSRLVRVLRHELMHAFVAEVGGAHVPGWLNEGLAQWYEPVGGAKAGPARDRLRGHELFRLEQLAGSLIGLEDPRDIERAYAQSLAFVLHMRDQYGEDVPFSLVKKLGQGLPLAASFEDLTRGITIETAIADLALSLDQ
ncbi:MAG: tetratricopeptide (TPR) repeat protein [Planctomycetota bacterium]|jgi:tetratricopeptide (TPR) repeat protein